MGIPREGHYCEADSKRGPPRERRDSRREKGWEGERGYKWERRETEERGTTVKAKGKKWAGKEKGTGELLRQTCTASKNSASWFLFCCLGNQYSLG